MAKFRKKLTLQEFMDAEAEKQAHVHPGERALNLHHQRMQDEYDVQHEMVPDEKPALPEVGDRVKFKAMTIYGNEWGWRKVRKVDTESGTVYVKFWGYDEFALHDYEILEVDKEYYKQPVG